MKDLDTAQGDRLARMRSVPLFADLPEDALQHILESAAEFEAAPGHVLVQPGEPGSGLFVIEEGKVRVEIGDREIELGPGEFFGELALLHENYGHSARVSAATPLKCLALRRDDFDELLEAQPRFAVALLKTVARRLVEATGR